MNWRRWWGGADALPTDKIALGQAAVTAVAVGREGDGLTLSRAGSGLDKAWGEFYAEVTEAREAWRKHPLARRLIGLTTAYTVGNGITLHSDDPALQRFITDFWQHNRMALRVDEWSDELARAGEIFPVLFAHADGRVTLRTVPACRIEAIETDAEDYEQELRYREMGSLGQEPTWWRSPAVAYSIPAGATAGDPRPPVMLHYAVNRPIGALRGESDLAPILPWLRRYSRWLEDRVRLNAAVRAFLWIVHAPARLHTQLAERYRVPPEAGSVIIAEQDAEQWTAVAPNLHAADAELDGRAIRWMIVAGGLGTALIDLGEGEDANLATGQAMAEQRRRFLRRRQAYLVWMLTDVVVQAYTLSVSTTRKQAGDGYPAITHAAITHAAITATAPDISPEDNQALATAAQQLSAALQQLATLTGEGSAYRRMALRLFAKFVGESLSEQEQAAILAEGAAASPTPSPTP